VSYVSETTIATGGHKQSGPDHTSLYCTQGVGASWISFQSDRRIKTNIRDVSFEYAMNRINNIPARLYEYKDKISKGSRDVVGFIAQEVRDVFPEATNLTTEFIPDEYRLLENVVWSEENKMSCDLSPVAGVLYRFYVSNNGEQGQRVDIECDENGLFAFDEPYKYVFCFGKQVKDFTMLNKDKIFALHHTAIQGLNTEIIELKTQIASIMSVLNM